MPPTTLTGLRSLPIAGFASAHFVPLSGFGYPLNGLLLPKPLDHYFRSKRSWVSPLQSFYPNKRSVPLSRNLCSHAVNPPGFPRVTLVDRNYRALIPSVGRLSPLQLLHLSGRLTLLGFRILEVFSPRSATVIFQTETLSYFMRSASSAKALYLRAYVLRDWLNH